MKVEELIKQLEPYKEFELLPILHLEVTEEELMKRKYKYPYDNFTAKLEIDDIGHSDKIVALGITPGLEE